MKFVADMHTHTIASTHAYSTVTENAAAAKKAGLSYIAMTDHGIKMEDAPHEWHFCNLKVIPDHLCGIRVIKGIEANICDYDGTLDLTEYMTDVEWVNISMHDPCIVPATADLHTRAYLKAIEHPKACVLCHTDSPQYPYDVDTVTKACAEKNVLIEFNVSRFRNAQSIENLRKLILPTCAKNKCSIIVNSDAHFHDKIGAFDKAQMLLCEIDFPNELVINADIERFEAFLKLKGIKPDSELCAE